MSAATVIYMGYFESQDRRTEQLNVRVSKTTRKSLEGLAELWEAMEKEKTEDDEVRVTVSDVVHRLIQVGLTGAWGELGGQPQTPAQFEAMKEAALDKIRAQKAPVVPTKKSSR